MLNPLTFRIQSLVGAMIIFLAAGVSMYIVWNFYQSTVEEIDGINASSSLIKIKSQSHNLRKIQSE